MPKTSPDPVDRRRLRELQPVSDLRHGRGRLLDSNETGQRQLAELGLTEAAEALASTPSYPDPTNESD
ncbi:hypothetical protein [Caldimonas brevitalea]|uniref:Uncharacterized protein n=1 Tax=Caldimonas brevitalea TaxID=413882 RepID=A0A0G3BTG4_9BURK|nr:hypothetical protein [Caldimonas brevitalea]AKJ30681.1 hypothetical protein AAW51_3990 [Caldimonas brevitalea]